MWDSWGSPWDRMCNSWGWSMRLWWGTYNTRIACEIGEGGTWCYGGGTRRTTCDIRDGCPWNFDGGPTVLATCKIRRGDLRGCWWGTYCDDQMWDSWVTIIIRTDTKINFVDWFEYLQWQQLRSIPTLAGMISFKFSSTTEQQSHFDIHN